MPNANVFQETFRFDFQKSMPSAHIFRKGLYLSLFQSRKRIFLFKTKTGHHILKAEMVIRKDLQISIYSLKLLTKLEPCVSLNFRNLKPLNLLRMRI